jgi:hypothetical protein
LCLVPVFTSTIGVIDMETITCYVTTLWKPKYLMTMKGTYFKSKEILTVNKYVMQTRSTL